MNPSKRPERPRYPFKDAAIIVPYSHSHGVQYQAPCIGSHARNLCGTTSLPGHSPDQQELSIPSSWRCRRPRPPLFWPLSNARCCPSCRNCQNQFVQMDQDQGQGIHPVSLARWIWGFLRQRVSRGCSSTLHPASTEPSQTEDISGGSSVNPWNVTTSHTMNAMSGINISCCPERAPYRPFRAPLLFVASARPLGPG